MSFLLDVLRGALIGVANIIPGVSGGTMMVTMGIYDKLIESITGLFKHLKKSILTLLPYFIGMGVGIVGFAFLLTKFLLVKFPLPTACAFIGLILGGIPLIVRKLKAAGSTESQIKAAETATENAAAMQAVWRLWKPSPRSLPTAMLSLTGSFLLSFSH